MSAEVLDSRIHKTIVSKARTNAPPNESLLDDDSVRDLQRCRAWSGKQLGQRTTTAAPRPG